jgi:hypothetical protein
VEIERRLNFGGGGGLTVSRKSAAIAASAHSLDRALMRSNNAARS